MGKGKKSPTYDLYVISHLILLVSYSAITLMLAIEIVALKWEYFTIPIFAFGLLIAWYLNITNRFSDKTRIWIYAVLMMVECVYFGLRSGNDIELTTIMIVTMLVFCATAITGLPILTIVTYVITSFVIILQSTESWQDLTIERLWQFVGGCLIVALSGIVARTIIRKMNLQKRLFSTYIERMNRERQVADETLINFAKELHRPLDVINGDTFLVKKMYDENGVNPYIGHVLSSAFIMEEKLDRISDFASVVSDTVNIKEKTYDIVDTLQKLRFNMRIKQTEIRVPIIEDIDPQIPKLLLGDQEKLITIITILLENSNTYTKDGAINLKAYSMGRDQSVNLCVEVTDTGKGIEPAYLARIFERLATGEAVNYRYGGLGIGLCIVYGFVRAMGGTVQLQSHFGVGTKVCVSIPQKTVNAEPCISFNTKSGQCAAFISPEKTVGKQAAEFYALMHRHAQEQLGIPIYYLDDESELEPLEKAYGQVCFFVPQQRYDEDSKRYEELHKRMFVTVLASSYFENAQGSSVHVIRKPFSVINVIHTLEMAKLNDQKKRKEDKKPFDAENIDSLNLPQTARDYEISRKEKKRIHIVVDSMADVPYGSVAQNYVDVIPFSIHTPNGVFRDNVEIGQESVLSHVLKQQNVYSMPPSKEEFEQFFERILEKADKVIYVSTSSKISKAYYNAIVASKDMENVRVIDSGQVSATIYLMVMSANDLIEQGASFEEVVAYLESLKKKAHTSFFVRSLRYLARSKRASSLIHLITKTFMVHPVMATKQGRFKLGAFIIGSMDSVKNKYVRAIEKRLPKMDKRRVVLCYIGMDGEDINSMIKGFKGRKLVDELIVIKASASITVNVGPGVMGLLYLNR